MKFGLQAFRDLFELLNIFLHVGEKNLLLLLLLIFVIRMATLLLSHILLELV